MAGCDARAGAGSVIVASEKVSQYLLIGQASESMEYMGRVQENQSTSVFFVL